MRLLFARVVLSGVCSLASGCSAGGTSIGGNTGEDGGLLPGDANEFITAHDVARKRVSPAPGTPLPPVSWNATVASTAQAYADKCNFMHNANRGSLGENLFANSGEGFSPKQVVTGWENEKANYDYATNTCAAGKICGHYTQVVWADSVELGCGMKICDVNSPFENFPHWQIWVCDYAPPGNYVGEKPY